MRVAIFFWFILPEYYANALTVETTNLGVLLVIPSAYYGSMQKYVYAMQRGVTLMLQMNTEK